MDRPNIPEEQVRAQVRRIAVSAGFVAAESVRRLLEFTVEKTLSGHAGEIKEFTLGIEVFGRKTPLDPQLDSIVRVQARSARAAGFARSSMSFSAGI
jgi:adenylate cyclase